MTKQEYLEQRRQLYDQLRELQRAYIRENAPYPIGTRLIDGKGQIGEVGAYTETQGNINVCTYKLRKDGKRCSVDRIYLDRKVRILEPAAAAAPGGSTAGKNK